MHSKPVRVWVPIGISRQAKVSASANSVTSLPRGKIVPWRASHQTSGMIAIATIDRVEPSYSPEFSGTNKRKLP